MTDPKDTLLREKGFGFFGAITASLSHQMNNVLATISELSGLLDDMLSAAEQGRELQPERLHRAAERIAKQVGRGRDYVKRLNRFAHTVDHPQAAIEVRDSLEALALLCRRFATLKRASLELDLGDEAPVLEGGMFDFQHVVYRCVRLAIDTANEGDTVRVRLEPRPDGVRVVVTGESILEGDGDFEQELDFVRLFVDELQGQIQIEVAAGKPVSFDLTLPSRLRFQGA